MRFNKTGQISFEVMVAVGVLLFFLVLVIIHTTFLNNTSETISSSYKEKNTCLEVMSAISNIYANGDGSSLVLTITHNTEVFGNIKTVKVNQEYCNFLAIMDSNYSLIPGEINISNNNGVVLIEQIS